MGQLRPRSQRKKKPESDAERYVIGMVQRLNANYAAVTGAQIKLRKGECA